eukprot:11041909-Ditylum_brightwellii.AAC.1
MHRPNRTHNMKDCFELKQRAKRAKADTNCGGADKVTYKDLNAFINTKVTAALNKAKKNKKKKGKKLERARLLACAGHNQNQRRNH